MAISVTKLNTRIFNLGGGWVKVTYDTGNKNPDGSAVTQDVTVSQASLEVSAGVLLPKARIKAILEAEINRVTAAQPVEITTAL